MSELPPVLQVEQIGPDRWSAPKPETDPEGRDVVFSGQLLAQMMMVSQAGLEGKETKSVHAIFARAGRYSAGPIEMVVEQLHSGRAWASTTVTALQDDRLLCRGLVLLNAVEPDLVAHGPTMPDVPGPDECPPRPIGVIYPGADVRVVDAAVARNVAGSPAMAVWFRASESYDSVAVNQAIVAWSQPGLIIGAALQAHPDEVDLAQAHRGISTGVISHTAHFHEHADVGDWLLFMHEAPYAGKGRIFGTGTVFRRDGTLVSTFGQDSMARKVEGELDFKTAM
jgi:acyl-CoA thioesterase-2